jgi:uncharacterized protein DUF1629
MFQSSAESKQLYQLLPDHIRCPDQWFVRDPRTAEGSEIDPRDFSDGRPYFGPAPVTAFIGNPGRELAFNLGAFDMPVVSAEVAAIIWRIAPLDVQCFAIDIPGATGSYQILNAVCSLDCLDEERSEFTRWQEGDGQPDRIGQYHSIPTIRIDPLRTQGHHVFRILNWPVALFVSGVIKNALVGIPNLGVVFDPV